MILVISFVVIDDSQNDDTHTDTRVDNDCTSFVHDGTSKPYAIVLSYKISYHVQEITTVLLKRL